METPTGSGRSGRPTRTHTPRLSARKRQLFRSQGSKLDQIDDESDVEDILLGLTPLKPRHQRVNNDVNNQSNVRKLFPKSADENIRSILNSSSSSISSVNSSPETNKENKRAQKTHVSGATTGSDEQLPHLFTATMRIIGSTNKKPAISSPHTSKARKDSNTDTEDTTNKQAHRAVKREHKKAATPPTISSSGSDVDVLTVDSPPASDIVSPECKIRKMEKECIPTISFYSSASSRTSWHTMTAVTPSARQQGRRRKGRVTSPKLTKVTSPTSRSKLGINKGVGHKIRKPMRSVVPTVLDDILGTLRNEKLRQLITTKREERAKVEEVHEILRHAKNPIQMAKPLSVMTADDDNNNNDNQLSAQLDFSDFTDDEDPNEAVATPVLMDLEEPVIPLIRHPDPLDTSPKADTDNLSKRKFFKSGRHSSTCMEVRITDNIRASVNQGKISLMDAPAKKQRKVRVRSATKFSAEQATVDAILRNLDDTVVDEIIESDPVPPKPQAEPAIEEEMLPQDPYIKYVKLLPYQTNDPATMEQQSLLLEFLISNNICTDENFEIFIADPENHKDEAARIVDELYTVINAEVQDPVVPECETLKAQPTMDSIEPQEKLFPIFTQRLQRIPEKSTRRKLNVPARLMAAATGSNQYQIDAGQKAFGARQCQQCGLVYTVHEPEEEQLHREYHNAVHILRFKGWIDEDIVAVYPDWAADGRIIRINEHAPLARLQRLTELVKVVDKELGFSSYIVPKTFVAYFAVRKQQIVGLCLVQPLTKANRFIQVDGIDYFSEETFEASCGISRIWVSPLHRRQKIASNLLKAVQFHTILGSEISRDKIAFSAPTDDGRALARHFTQNDNFLAYDQ